MSTLEEHEAEQAEITAMCEAGECDHPECHEDDDKCRTCGEHYDGCGDGWDGECPDCAGSSYMNEIVTRSAPRWAWDVIDELLDMAPENPRPGVDVDSEGDLIVEGAEGTTNMVRAMYLASIAMGLSCENANDEPISRAEVGASAI